LAHFKVLVLKWC